MVNLLVAVVDGSNRSIIEKRQTMVLPGIAGNSNYFRSHKTDQ